MREDKFNTIENIESTLELNGSINKVRELEARGIHLTPIQTNIMFLGGRQYGKTFMSYIKGAENILKLIHDKSYMTIDIKDIGYRDRDFNISYQNKTRYFKEFIEFLEYYYPEIIVSSKNIGNLTFSVKDKYEKA